MAGALIFGLIFGLGLGIILGDCEKTTPPRESSSKRRQRVNAEFDRMRREKEERIASGDADQIDLL